MPNGTRVQLIIGEPVVKNGKLWTRSFGGKGWDEYDSETEAIASPAYTHLLALRLETLTRLYRELQQLRGRVRRAEVSSRRRRTSCGPLRRSRSCGRLAATSILIVMRTSDNK